MAKDRQRGRPPFDPDKVKAPMETPSLFASLGPAEPSVLTVTALNRLVRGAIQKELSGTLHVVGEISNLSRPSGGHVYFTLKDNESEVRCVMWQSAAATLKFQPPDGLAVIATGTIDVYEPRGQYQLYVRKLEPMEPRAGSGLSAASRSPEHGRALRSVAQTEVAPLSSPHRRGHEPDGRGDSRYPSNPSSTISLRDGLFFAGESAGRRRCRRNCGRDLPIKCRECVVGRDRHHDRWPRRRVA